MDSLAYVSVTLGVIAASISILIFESQQIRSARTPLTEMHPRSEGVFTYFLVLFGTIMAFLYVVLLFIALFVQIQRVIMVS